MQGGKKNTAQRAQHLQAFFVGIETGGQVLLSDRVQPLHFWVGLQNHIFSLGWCLLFSQTKLIPDSYYHFSKWVWRGGSRESQQDGFLGRSLKASWTVLHAGGVCLGFGEAGQGQGGFMFLLAQPAIFSPDITECCSVELRDRSCHPPNLPRCPLQCSSERARGDLDVPKSPAQDKQR